MQLVIHQPAKYSLGILVGLLSSLISLAQPAINRVEYFMDTDPGYGLATNVSFIGTTNATGSVNIDLTPLSQGVHVFGLRSRDANGAWSLDNKWLFLKPYTTGIVAAQPNINRVEYFIDTDPGYGNGTTVNIIPGQDLSTLAINLDMTLLTSGVHLIGIRSKDANGAWSLDNKWLFLKPYPNGNSSIQPVINRVEYFIDSDPGYGHATPLSITSGQDLNNLAININLIPLTEGVHLVGVRSQDANGAWSLDNKWLFLKPYANGVAVIPPNITKVEWYIDHDPGYGNATPVSITPGQDLPALSVNIGTTPLTEGVHLVGIRSMDANGAWSIDNKWIFLKPYTSNAAPSAPNISAIEYYIDTDPGYGNGIQVPFTAGSDLSNLTFTADISSFYAGNHLIGIRTRDVNGAWSLDNKYAFFSGISWIGVTSTDWNTGSNWSKGFVPDSSIRVAISSGTPYSPVINNGIIGVCKSIKINVGSVVTVSTGGNLKIGQ